MTRHLGQITQRPCLGSVDVKLTRTRSNRTTLTVLIVVPQTGHTAGYSRAYSASLSRTSSPSLRIRAGAAVGESLTNSVSERPVRNFTGQL